MKFIIISSIIIVYLFVTIYVSKRIDKSLYFSEQRRELHKKIIWIIPFLGSLILISFWKKRKTRNLEIFTKKKRKIDKSHFYESGKGIWGA